jgi:hypothetical protein
MSRTISNHEILRRGAMCKAKLDILKAMEQTQLTAMEWANVLNEIQQRMIAIGLKEDWEEGVR